MELSFWEKESYFAPVDVAIIGSGIVGLNAAWHLKRTNSNLKVTVLERGLLPTGASSRNAGFACFGSPSELLSDLQHHTEGQVFGLVERRWKGLEKLRKNLGDSVIDYHRWGGYELFFPEDELYRQCADKLPYLNKMLASVIGEKEVFKQADTKISHFGFGKISHLIESTCEGQIDTGKMITALTREVQSAGVQVLCGLEVKALYDIGEFQELVLAQGPTIKARQVIVCTNGFARQLLPDLNVVPARAQVLITAPIPDLKIKGVFHFDEGYYYFRNIGNRVLFGGARNLDFAGEETFHFGTTPHIQNKLEQMLQEVILPTTEHKIEHRWSGIMGMGQQKGPIIKAVNDKVVCAVRLGGMGVAIGSLVGEEAAEMVLQTL